MTEQELKSWLTNKIYSCYPVKNENYQNIILWYYDESHIRKQKLCKLNNQEIKQKSKVTGFCLFEQDILSKSLYFNNNKIWRIIFRDLNLDYFETKDLITKVLKTISNLSEYTPFCSDSVILQNNDINRLFIMKDDDPYHVHTHIKKYD